MINISGNRKAGFTFKMLGQLLNSIGTYRFLFSKEQKVLIDENGRIVKEIKINSSYYSERVKKEINLQMSLWHTLQLNHCIGFEVLADIMIILHTLKKQENTKIEGLTYFLLLLLEFLKSHPKFSRPIIDRLITQFRELNSYNYKINQTKKQTNAQSTNYCYSPKICNKSRELADRNLSKYCDLINDALHTDSVELLAKCEPVDETVGHEIPDEKESFEDFSKNNQKGSLAPANARILTMLIKHKQTQEKINQEKKQKYDSALDKCTFKPSLNTKQYKTKQKSESPKRQGRHEKCHKDSDDKSIENCTFSPSITKKYNRISS